MEVSTRHDFTNKRLKSYLDLMNYKSDKNLGLWYRIILSIIVYHPYYFKTSWLKMDYFKLCYIPLIKQFKTQVTKTCEIKVWFSNVVCWRTDWQLTKLYEIGYMWDKIVEITGRCIWFLYHGHLKFGRDSINEKTKSQIWLFGHRKWAWKKWIETLTWFIIFRTVYIVIFSDFLLI